VYLDVAAVFTYFCNKKTYWVHFGMIDTMESKLPPGTFR